MSTASTPSLPYQSPPVSRAVRKLGIATTAVVAIAFGAYDLSRAADSGAIASASAGMRAMPIIERVAPTAALPGYVLVQQPKVVRAPAQWAAGLERASAVQGEANRLQRLGFVAGVDEQLHGRYPLKSEAISIVEQFRSAAGARAELARQYAVSTAGIGSKTSTFAVLGIPGAKAWQVNDQRHPAVNIAFSNGPFYYLVGASLPASGNVMSSRDEVVRAAQVTNLVANGCVATGRTAQLGSAARVRPTPQFGVH